MATAVASVYMACIVIERCLRDFRKDRARTRGPLDQTSARLMDRDFRYTAGFSGSNTLPSKKVSLPRDFDAGISAAATLIFLAASRQRSSRVTLPIIALASRPGSDLP